MQMGRKNYQYYRSRLDVHQLILDNLKLFKQIPDPRNRVINQSLADVCQSGFAMFHLKFPSLLDFDSATVHQKANLQSVYGIKSVCSDSQMRRILDDVAPTHIMTRIAQLLNYEFQKVGGARQFQVFDQRLILSLDGVEHFRSNKVRCENCLEKTSSSKGTSYYHQMLCGSIVHPDESQVFLAAAEPIIKQDGATKNDCERNAAKRVITGLKTTYPDFKFLVVADGLYSCGPVIDLLKQEEHDFIIAVKPGDHDNLFTHFGTWSQRSVTTKMKAEKKGVTHRFEWANGIALNQSWADMKLNMLVYEQVDRKGKITRFSWVTNRKITKRNVEMIMRIGRSRWKIENETFNTLKNQGYHFEHNYGHGKKHLCSTLAFLMLLAFLIDQLIELCSQPFQLILKAARTRKKVWFQQRAIFTSVESDNFNSIYGRLAELFGVQLI